MNMQERPQKERRKADAFSLFFRFRNTRPPKNAEETSKTAQEAGARNAQFHRAHSYLGFLLLHFRRGTPYALYRRIRAFAYPALFLGRVFRIASYVFLVIRTSAVLLLSVTVLCLLLPPFLLFLLFLSLRAAFDRRASDRRYAHLFEGCRVLVLFPAGEGDFIMRHAAALAHDYTVLLVSDFPSTFLEGASLAPHRAAFLRKDGVLVVREHYYFHLRRRLLAEATFFAAIY